MRKEEDFLGTGIRRKLIVASIALAVSALPLLMVLFVLDSDAPIYLGRRGARVGTPIPRSLGVPLLLCGIAIIAIPVAAALWRAFRGRGPSRASDEARGLGLGEMVRWTGRAGWRSFRGPRVVGAALAFAVPVALAWWAWNAATADAPLYQRAFFMMLPWTLLFGSILPGRLSAAGYLHHWLCDVFGSIAITERRIAWLSPLRQRVYREIAATDLVDVFLSETRGRRGSITLVKARREDVEHVYLDGVPEPEAALAALTLLIRHRG